MTYQAIWSDAEDGEFRNSSGNASDLARILRDLAADIEERQVLGVEATIILDHNPPTSITIKTLA